MSIKKQSFSEPQADLTTSPTRSPTRFINRELSWLAFNHRVVQEALRLSNPLLERLKFLSISSSNLDEFIMVRVAGLKDQLANNIDILSADGRTTQQQLDEIAKEITNLVEIQQNCWQQIRQELSAQDINIIGAEAISAEEKIILQQEFEQNIFPALTPIALDTAHPFPHLPNLGCALLFELEHVDNSKRQQLAILPLPPKLPRFVKIGEHSCRFILLEDLIKLFFSALFPRFQLKNSEIFRIIRDSDLEISDEADDLILHYETALKQRRLGEIVHIEANAPVLEHLRDLFVRQAQAKTEDVLEVAQMVALNQIAEIYNCARPELKFPSFNVRFPERIRDYDGDCFAAIRAKDIVVHHPFEDFDVVVQFLRQAAHDADVVSIKQTLYRTSKDSPIVSALIEAAEAGKSVTALVELKARFDEEANIKWARDLERAGVQVVYGFVKLKTHAKMSLVVRREEGNLCSYAHFGTGNYHPITAKIYTDISFFTCDAALCKDAMYLFNYITGYAAPDQFAEIIAAPVNLRQALLAKISEEIAHAQAGRPAAIWAKMNALVDETIIDALYVASQAGVQIDLVIRGICCLRPQVKGLSENIRVKSIVGRFLEHARIFCFGAGQGIPSPEAKLYISSADWMMRNFDRRVEIMVPIKNPTVHAQILDQIMVANLKDNLSSWELQSDGNYVRTKIVGKEFSAHDYFMQNPSLSGRGKALRSAKKIKLLDNK